MAEAGTISMAEAIREGLIEAGVRDSSVLFFAEGVADPSGVFGTLRGLENHVKPEQIVEMPVAENGLMGVAIGSALQGKRPVISFHRVEFALLAMEQLVNNAAKLHYISGGQHRVPLVVRMVVGRGWGQGPEHSQSLETLFAYIPGLKVVMPAFPADAKALITAAVEDDNPVIFIEHRWCHYATGAVPARYVAADLSGPAVVREGTDVTIVASAYMVLEALRAADELAELGVSAEVIDLRVLRPLDVAPIVASVERTGQLLTVDTGFRTLGIGAEIVSRVVEASFGRLRAAPRRLGLPEHPTPSSRGLIPGFYPDAARIVLEIGEMLDLDPAGVRAAQDRLAEQRGDLPVDVPDPFFKGPF